MSIILSVDERIMALKIRHLRTCGDGVSLTFVAVMRCSLIFFAVLRCSEPPHVPLIRHLPSTTTVIQNNKCLEVVVYIVYRLVT